MPVALRFDPERELEELREYTGPAFEPGLLLRWEELVDDELADRGDESSLYRHSEMYPYNLTAFAITGTKLPYLAELTSVVPPPAKVLDYGCGIGSDGLMLLEAGYEVAFADFDNPSTRYLRWRLRRRGLGARVYDLDRETPPSGFAAAFAFDVIEHVPDPYEFLARLERSAALVCVNLLVARPEDSRLHRALPIRKLLLRAAFRGLVRYRRPYRHSHLAIYRARRGGWTHALQSPARLLIGRFASSPRISSATERRLHEIGDRLAQEANQDR